MKIFVFMATNSQVFDLSSSNTPNCACSGIDIHRLAVGIGGNVPMVIHHRNVRPFILRRDVARVEPRPARIAVGKRPANRSLAETGHSILTLLDQDNPIFAVWCLRMDPGADRNSVGHHELYSVSDAQTVIHTVKTECLTS